MKTCPRCQTAKEPSEFYKNRKRPDGLQDWCKTCLNAANSKVGDDGLTSLQRWNKKNPERQPSYMRKWKYGLTTEQFNAMLAEQGGACAICRDSEKKWCVDHDHATGKVRAILCYCCNIAIGNLGDSARLASAAAEYLTKHGNP